MNMRKMKDQHKQMKKQLKKFEKQIETYGKQADAIESKTLKHSQQSLVNLVDAMDAQLKVWQNGMTEVNTKLNGNKSNSIVATLNSETTAVWNSMQKQMQQWLGTTATVRLEVGADAQWQLKALQTLDTTVSEKLLALKNAQNGARGDLKESAEQALNELKHALERVLPE
jgi:hypothetical protein